MKESLTQLVFRKSFTSIHQQIQNKSDIFYLTLVQNHPKLTLILYNSFYKLYKNQLLQISKRVKSTVISFRKSAYTTFVSPIIQIVLNYNKSRTNYTNIKPIAWQILSTVFTLSTRRTRVLIRVRRSVVVPPWFPVAIWRQHRDAPHLYHTRSTRYRRERHWRRTASRCRTTLRAKLHACALPWRPSPSDCTQNGGPAVELQGRNVFRKELFYNCGPLDTYEGSIIIRWSINWIFWIEVLD